MSGPPFRHFRHCFDGRSGCRKYVMRLFEDPHPPSYMAFLMTVNCLLGFSHLFVTVDVCEDLTAPAPACVLSRLQSPHSFVHHRLHSCCRWPFLCWLYSSTTESRRHLSLPTFAVSFPFADFKCPLQYIRPTSSSLLLFSFYVWNIGSSSAPSFLPHPYYTVALFFYHLASLQHSPSFMSTFRCVFSFLS
ncbi:hypothetical protein BS47DRAFT_881665 [Hydnum rufescens UP504]|uniref:Uncharacterized protein n=1 Tax=Hydnum rufescens UP504 TaxID=1448309 RepID=A0A9P6ACB8_9AGAM|nr:hypothetical protein BS47DRAFT_881665 [Hydnum rufescens UP504]